MPSNSHERLKDVLVEDLDVGEFSNAVLAEKFHLHFGALDCLVDEHLSLHRPVSFLSGKPVRDGSLMHKPDSLTLRRLHWFVNVFILLEEILELRVYVSPQGRRSNESVTSLRNSMALIFLMVSFIFLVDCKKLGSLFGSLIVPFAILFILVNTVEAVCQ